MAVRKDYAAPTGLKIILALGSTNMPRLTALGTGALRRMVAVRQDGRQVADRNGRVARSTQPRPSRAANGSFGWTNLECAGRAGAATALSGGREIKRCERISVRAKAGSRCACPRSPRHAGAMDGRCRRRREESQIKNPQSAIANPKLK